MDSWLSKLGPSLITAADDDPSGIATYAQAGALFGYGQASQEVEIGSSAQAAEALRPIAGNYAFVLFSLGTIGTGLLAVPVLAGSAAYAIAGALRWKNSLELQVGSAKKFYAIIVAATLAGTALCFTRIEPMRALYWSAVLNGVIALPVMVVVVQLATRRAVMGELAISPRLRVLGWLCTGVMALAVVAMFATLG